MSILDLFCDVDDCWQACAAQWQEELVKAGDRKRQRAGELCPSEIMTILIHFHQSCFRHFKGYYTRYVQTQLQREFPHLVSYTRFVELMPSVLGPLCLYLQQQYGDCTGISFVDSTALAVCTNRRISSNKVFAGLAKRGKTSTGWFYGFQVHLVSNDRGELLGFCLTPGNVDDRRPVPHLAQRLYGKLFGDKGYLSQPLLERLLEEHHVLLLTKRRKNMPNALMDPTDKLLLRQRTLSETVNDQLKNSSQIEHSRHRSPVNFLVNLVSGLIAYCLQPKKPSLGLDHHLLLAA